MARDATARLYDVATSKVVLKRRFDREEYDIGEVVFVAKKDRLINLDKLRESIQATRLSGGTKSGVLHLTVTVEGQVFPGEEELTMLPSGSDEVFQLENVSEENAKTGEKTKFDELREAVDKGKAVTKVTGRVVGWQGTWPGVLNTPHAKPTRIRVTGFELSK